MVKVRKLRGKAPGHLLPGPHGAYKWRQMYKSIRRRQKVHKWRKK